MLTRLSIAAAALLIAAAGAAAQTTPKAEPAKTTEKQPAPKKLSVGDTAPSIQVEKWVKGDPITGFEKGRVYVMEFWATWCGPCVKAFPHLSELQAKYKDKVTIVGVNIWERNLNDETFNKVKDFVAGQGDKMAYTVAYDGAAKAMTTSYMEAAGRNGIPSAFIVDKAGKIAWMGHPAGMDAALEGIVAGTWDMNKAKQEAAEAAAAAESQTAVAQIMRNTSSTAATKLEELDKLVAKTPASKPVVAQALNAIAWPMVDPKGSMPKDKIDLELAMKAAKKAVEYTNEKDGMILDTLARVYFVKGDVDKAITLQTKAVELAPAEMKAEMQASLDEFKAAKK
jgi:thiol-disulfide isomerase/thioredoxin